MIEWVPRSRGDDGWREVVAGSYRGHAVLEHHSGDAVVRVPVANVWVKPNAGGAYRTLVVKEQPGNLVYGLYANSDTNQPQSLVAHSCLHL